MLLLLLLLAMLRDEGVVRGGYLTPLQSPPHTSSSSQFTHLQEDANANDGVTADREGGDTNIRDRCCSHKHKEHDGRCCEE